MEFPKRTLHPCKFARGRGVEPYLCDKLDGAACPFQRYCHNEKRWVPNNCKDNCKNFQSKTE
jgi:hypothetical protein